MRRLTSVVAAASPVLQVVGKRSILGPNSNHQTSPHPRHQSYLRGEDLNQLTKWEDSMKKPTEYSNPTDHAVWDLKDVEKVTPTHKAPNDRLDNAALVIVQTMRSIFDVVSGFTIGRKTEKKYITRIIFLETVAGVPGMVAGMVRHLQSLRLLKRDHGWIHTLLEEAENERMHLLTFMEMRHVGILFRAAILIMQGIFFNAFFLAYLVSPRFCHRMVGYIEEEAVKTYTHLLADIDAGVLPQFKVMQAPPIAVAYWKLKKDATFRDLIVAVRADEASHRLVNHTFADMHVHDLADATNPFLEVDQVEPKSAEAPKPKADSKPPEK